MQLTPQKALKLAEPLRDARVVAGKAMGQMMGATEVGARARALLAEPKRRWRVLASVRGAIYIKDKAEEILWLASSRAALHARAIVVADALPLDEIPQGAPCFVRKSLLCIGGSALVDVGRAAVWLPAIARIVRRGPAEWGRRLERAVQQAARGSAPPGSLIHAMLRLPGGAGGGSSRGKLALRLLLRGARALGSVTAAGKLPCALEEARGLVGLGEGLTPSGDDLLGGYLFVLHLFDRASGCSFGIDWDGVREWARSASSLTNGISHTILADHARGEAGFPLWALSAHAVGGAEERDLAESAACVSRIGHSSGWDMLAGAHCGALVAASLARVRRT
jgi:hypothetical protein